MDKFTIPKELLVETLTYLTTKPYAEVVNLINKLQNGAVPLEEKGLGNIQKKDKPTEESQKNVDSKAIK